MSALSAQRFDELCAMVAQQVRARGDNLAEFAALLSSAASTGSLPDPATVPRDVLATGGAALAAVLVLAVAPARRCVLAAADTAVASVLLVLLALLMLGLPFGACTKGGRSEKGGQGSGRRECNLKGRDKSWPSLSRLLTQPTVGSNKKTHKTANTTDP